MAQPNENNIRVTVLGSGTCVPCLARSSCSILLQVGDTQMVFDAGPGTMRRLLEAGTDIYRIDYVFFSHFHPDHTAELVPFLFANKFPDPMRRSRPLTLVGGPESVAFRIATASGCAVVYSGDTDYSERLVALARQVGLLICEAAVPDDQKIPGHLTPSLAGEMAAQADVQRLMLTHFYPACDQTDIAAQCRRTYNGPLLLAEDLMTVIVE